MANVKQTKTVSKAQKPSKAAMKDEARKTPSSNDALKQELLQEPVRSPERMGAAHRIKGTRPGPDVSSGAERSGVITSVPVTTNWEAIEAAFGARTVQRKIQLGTSHDGEVGG